MVSNGWRTLAMPTYGVSNGETPEDRKRGVTALLPAGTKVDVIWSGDEFNMLSAPLGPGTVEIAAFRPGDEDPTFWYATAAALRFETGKGRS